MTMSHWYGTEDSLTHYVEVQKQVMQNMAQYLAMHNDTLARLNRLDDDDDEPGAQFHGRLGDRLIQRTPGGTAVVGINGSLVTDHKWWHNYVDDVTSYAAIKDAMDIVMEDESITNAVVSVSSGGGAAMGVDDAAQKIQQAAKVKKLVSHTGTAAFSAGYWLLAATGRIGAGRMAQVGSIGTLMVHQSIAKMAEEAGVKFTVFRAGQFKAVGLPYEDLDDDMKNYLQQEVEKANSYFLEHVSTSRGVSVSEKHRWAEGKTFYAREGRDLGLVDEILSLDDLVGSLSVQTPTWRSSMNISAEKRAQIAAGADPADVLTADELSLWQEELAAADAATDTPEPEASASETPVVEPEAPAPEASAPAGASVSMAEYGQLMRDNGKLESQLETLQAAHTALEAKLAANEEQLGNLKTVAVAALHNLQTALQKPKETPASVTEILGAYNTLQSEMSTRFPTAQQSRSVPEPKDTTQATSDWRLNLASQTNR